MNTDPKKTQTLFIFLQRTKNGVYSPGRIRPVCNLRMEYLRQEVNIDDESVLTVTN